MLTVEEARDRILGSVEPLAPIELPLLEAHGCVLAVDVVADFDVPPFSASVVEGYAARSADIHAATPESPASLRVVGEVTGGQPPGITVGWGEAARMESGAPLPAGADCVVPLDRCKAGDEAVDVLQPVEEGDFVSPAGRDVRAGQVLVPAGRRLSAPELAVMAGAGQASPPAYPKVRVAVLSVGELVEPGRPVALGQVRDVGSYEVFGALRDVGAIPYRVGSVPSDPSLVREAVLENLVRADCFVCTMGAGEEDLAAEVLDGFGRIEFPEVAMFPGRSHGFGDVDGTPFFVLPGAPLSAFVVFEVLVRPAMLRMMGRRDVTRPEVGAVLDEDVEGPPGSTLFIPAHVQHREGDWHARPTGPLDPGLLHTVVAANGLVVIPPGPSEVTAGETVRVRIFRPLER